MFAQEGHGAQGRITLVDGEYHQRSPLDMQRQQQLRVGNIAVDDLMPVGVATRHAPGIVIHRQAPDSAVLQQHRHGMPDPAIATNQNLTLRRFHQHREGIGLFGRWRGDQPLSYRMVKADQQRAGDKRNKDRSHGNLPEIRINHARIKANRQQREAELSSDRKKQTGTPRHQGIDSASAHNKGDDKDFAQQDEQRSKQGPMANRRKD
ncbi:MAG: hypothetical protein BWY57_01127 [Betaproteobacteria bacterium ADurb.Bin341]|nr:MAG: hypothetical protein BWY57_01127 [Betaproteobacteria bacterium ADurb.Bin341]